MLAYLKGMQVIRLEKVDSTQSYLTGLVDERRVDGECIVSTKCQLDGFGRRGRSWQHVAEALAFSFTVFPLRPETLTPLEMGVLICDFFYQNYGINLQLKWPNDILNDKGEKCGGIITQLKRELAVCGVGLNLRQVPTQKYPYPVGAIGTGPFGEEDYFKLPEQIYAFILKKRAEVTTITSRWNQKCSHLDRESSIHDGQKNSGIFKGVGPMGEAILDIGGVLKKFYSGSLEILDK